MQIGLVDRVVTDPSYLQGLSNKTIEGKVRYSGRRAPYPNIFSSRNLIEGPSRALGIPSYGMDDSNQLHKHS